MTLRPSGRLALGILAGLERQWQNASARYGACVRANVAAQDLSSDSTRIASLVMAIEQTKREISRLADEKQKGATFTPDPEMGLQRNLAGQERELAQRWSRYRAAGGAARSPEEVKAVPDPCGQPPTRPSLF